MSDEIAETLLADTVPASVAEPEELTLEQLHGLITNPEDEKKVSDSLQLDEGTYNSVPELSMTLRTSGERAKSGPGRKFARFFGSFVGTGDVVGKKGKAGFAVSWEAHYDKEGKADLMSRLWLQAKQTYNRAMGLDPKAPAAVLDVLTFLQKYSVGVRFGKGDDSNITWAITTVKE